MAKESQKKEKKEKTTTLDLLNSLSKKFNLSSLPPYKIFNLLLTFMGLILIISLNIQPVFVLVNEIIITIGKVIIILCKGNPDLLERNLERNSISAYLSIGFLLAETIGCVIYCHFARKREEKKSNNP